MIVNLKCTSNCTGCDLNVHNLIANGWVEKFHYESSPILISSTVETERIPRFEKIWMRFNHVIGSLFIVWHEQNFVEDQTSDTIGHGVTDKLEIKQISNSYSWLSRPELIA